MRELDKTQMYFFTILAVLVRGSGGVCLGEAKGKKHTQASFFTVA